MTTSSFDHLHHWKLTGLCTFKNPRDMRGTGLAIANSKIGPVALQTASTSAARRAVNGRNCVTRGKRPDFIAIIGEERNLADNECHGLGIESSCKWCVKLVFGGRCD